MISVIKNYACVCIERLNIFLKYNQWSVSEGKLKRRINFCLQPFELMSKTLMSVYFFFDKIIKLQRKVSAATPLKQSNCQAYKASRGKT